MNINPLNSPNQLLTSQDAQTQAQMAKRLTSTSSPVSNSTAATPAPKTLAEKRQEALLLVDQTLARAYEKLSSRALSATEQYQAFEPLTAEKVANNILGFIERRLRQDAAEGATPEQLEARLEAGLSGFKKGFAEAEEKLKALDLLAPEVSADIGKTYDLVIKGIDDLRQGILDGVKTPEPQAEPPSTALVNAGSRIQSFANLGSASSRSFEFELTTREGDKVRISAAASQSLGLAYAAARDGQSSSLSLEGSYSSSQRFSLSIEGELNDDELGAINKLLGDVNDLAGRFYAGDLDAAWNQALALGFDSTQIADYAFRLTQVDVQVVNLRETITNGAPATNLPEPVNSASDFVSSLLSQLDAASTFREPFKLLESLVAGVDRLYRQDKESALNNPVSFADFIRERLLELSVPPTDIQPEQAQPDTGV